MMVRCVLRGLGRQLVLLPGLRGHRGGPQGLMVWLCCGLGRQLVLLAGLRGHRGARARGTQRGAAAAAAAGLQLAAAARQGRHARDHLGTQGRAGVLLSRTPLPLQGSQPRVRNHDK